MNLISGDIAISNSISTSHKSITSGEFIVLARDGGGLSVEQAVTYEFIDINEHTPVFTQPQSVVISIAEVSAGAS